MIKLTNSRELKLEWDLAGNRFFHALRIGTSQGKIDELRRRYGIASDNYTAVKYAEKGFRVNIPGVIVLRKSELSN